MRTMRRKMVLMLMFSVIMGASCVTLARAQQVDAPEVVFDKDTVYDVYYEVNAYEVNRVDNVRIVGTVSINGLMFLRVRYGNIADREGFIALAGIRAILPTQAAKPYRSSDVRKQY
jgi:hypothetical protein